MGNKIRQDFINLENKTFPFIKRDKQSIIIKIINLSLEN